MGSNRSMVQRGRQLLAVTLSLALLLDARWAVASDVPTVRAAQPCAFMNTNALMSRLLWLRTSPATVQRSESNTLLRAAGWGSALGAVGTTVGMTLWQMAQQTVATAAPVVQKLTSLTLSEPILRVVQAGDTLSALFGSKNVSMVAKLNHIANPNFIRVGDVLQTGHTVSRQLPVGALPDAIQNVPVYAHPLIHHVMEPFGRIVAPIVSFVQHLVVSAGGAWHQVAQSATSPEHLLVFATFGLVASAALIWTALTKGAKLKLTAALGLGLTVAPLFSTAAQTPVMTPEQLLNVTAANQRQTANLAAASSAANDDLNSYAPSVIVGYQGQFEKGPLAYNGLLSSIGPRVDIIINTLLPGDQLKAAARRDSARKATIAAVQKSQDENLRLTAVVNELVTLSQNRQRLAQLKDLKALAEAIAAGSPADPLMQERLAALDRDITQTQYEIGQSGDTAQDLAGLPIEPGGVDLKTTGLTPEAAHALLQTLSQPLVAGGPAVTHPEIAKGLLDTLTAAEAAEGDVIPGERSKWRAVVPAKIDLALSWQHLTNVQLGAPGYLANLLIPTWNRVKKPAYATDAKSLEDARKALQDNVNLTFLRIHRLHQLFNSSDQTARHAQAAIEAAQSVARDLGRSAADQMDAVKSIQENTALLNDALGTRTKTAIVLLGSNFTADELQTGLHATTDADAKAMTLLDATHAHELIGVSYKAYLQDELNAFNGYLAKKPKRNKKIRAQRDQLAAALKAMTGAAMISPEEMVAQLDATSATETPEQTADLLNLVPDFATTMLPEAPDPSTLPSPPPFYARTDPSAAQALGYSGQEPPIYASIDAAAIAPGLTALESVTFTPTFNGKSVKKAQTFYTDAYAKVKAEREAEAANAALFATAQAAIQHDALTRQVRFYQDELKAFEQTGPAEFSTADRARMSETMKAKIASYQSQLVQLEQRFGAATVDFDDQGLPKGFDGTAMLKGDLLQIHLAHGVYELNNKQYTSLPIGLGTQVNVVKEYRPNAVFSWLTLDISGVMKKVFSRKHKASDQDLAVVGAWLQAEQNLRSVMSGEPDARSVWQMQVKQSEAYGRAWAAAKDAAGLPDLSEDDRRQAEADVQTAYDAYWRAKTAERVAAYTWSVYRDRLAFYKFIFTASDAEINDQLKDADVKSAVKDFRAHLKSVWTGEKPSHQFDEEKRLYSIDQEVAAKTSDSALVAPALLPGLMYGPGAAFTWVPPTSPSAPTTIAAIGGAHAVTGIDFLGRSKVAQEAKRAKEWDLKAADDAAKAAADLQAPVTAGRASAAAELILLQKDLETALSQAPRSSEDAAFAKQLLGQYDVALARYAADGIAVDPQTPALASVARKTQSFNRVDDVAAFAKAIAAQPTATNPHTPVAPSVATQVLVDAFWENIIPPQDAKTFFKTGTYGTSVQGVLPGFDFGKRKLSRKARKAAKANAARQEKVALIARQNGLQMALKQINHDQDQFASARKRYVTAMENLDLYKDYYSRGIVDAHDLMAVSQEALDATGDFGVLWGRIVRGQIFLNQLAGLKPDQSFDIDRPELRVGLQVFEPLRAVAPTLALSDRDIQDRLKLNALAEAVLGSRGDRKTRADLNAFMHANDLQRLPVEQVAKFLKVINDENKAALNVAASSSPQDRFIKFVDDVAYGGAVMGTVKKNLSTSDLYELAIREPDVVESIDKDIRPDMVLAKRLGQVNGRWTADLESEWVAVLSNLSDQTLRRVHTALVGMDTPAGFLALDRLIQESGLYAPNVVLAVSRVQDAWARVERSRLTRFSDDRVNGHVDVALALLRALKRVDTLTDANRQQALDQVLVRSARLFMDLQSPKRPSKSRPKDDVLTARLLGAIAELTDKDLNVGSTKLLPSERALRTQAIAMTRLIEERVEKSLAASVQSPVRRLKTHGSPRFKTTLKSVLLPLVLFGAMLGMPHRSQAQSAPPPAPLAQVTQTQAWRLPTAEQRQADFEIAEKILAIEKAYEAIPPPVEQYINTIKNDLLNMRLFPKNPSRYERHLFETLYEFFQKYPEAKADLQRTWNQKRTPAILSKADDPDVVYPWKPVDPINWAKYARFEKTYTPDSEGVDLVPGPLVIRDINPMSTLGSFWAFLTGGLLIGFGSLRKKIVRSPSRPAPNSVLKDLERVAVAA